jgi:hypothetical protein
MTRLLPLLALALLAACADARQAPLASPQLDSGVTASRGGGEQTLGNQPSIGITTRVR